MCIIFPEVQEVHDTKILVAKHGSKQLTVYGNSVTFDKFNQGIMILPFPAGPVDFVNLSNLVDPFELLDQNFPQMRSMSDSYSYNSVRPASAKTFLKVFDVGSYSVSVATTVDEIDNLNPNKFEFSLSDELRMVLNKYYNSNNASKTTSTSNYSTSNSTFHFLICKLEKSKKYHPFAYYHSLLNNQHLFIPTRHFHDTQEETVSHWSHKIYAYNIQNFNFFNSSNNEINDKDIYYEKSYGAEHLPAIVTDKVTNIFRLKLNKMVQNNDIVVY